MPFSNTVASIMVRSGIIAGGSGVIWIYTIRMRLRLISQKEIQKQAKEWHEQDQGPEYRWYNSQWTTHPQSHDDNQRNQFKRGSDDERWLIHMPVSYANPAPCPP